MVGTGSARSGGSGIPFSFSLTATYWHLARVDISAFPDRRQVTDAPVRLLIDTTGTSITRLEPTAAAGLSRAAGEHSELIANIASSSRPQTGAFDDVPDPASCCLRPPARLRRADTAVHSCAIASRSDQGHHITDRSGPVCAAAAGDRPALMGGRIADIVVHPHDRSVWYVAVGSGGVWKTDNAGTTWTPIFDRSALLFHRRRGPRSHPIPTSSGWAPARTSAAGTWAGATGVYKQSRRWPESWEQMRAGASRSISADIVVDPRDGDVVLRGGRGAPCGRPAASAASIRPTERRRDLGAASYDDRRRAPASPNVEMRPTQSRRALRRVLPTAAAQGVVPCWPVGRAPACTNPTDAGVTWRRLDQRSSPKGDMGKIGLAISPVDPDVVYATIEAGEGEHGFYRSTRSPASSWRKRNLLHLQRHRSPLLPGDRRLAPR